MFEVETRSGVGVGFDVGVGVEVGDGIGVEVGVGAGVDLGVGFDVGAGVGSGDNTNLEKPIIVPITAIAPASARDLINLRLPIFIALFYIVQHLT